ncbi:MAG: hypothetical protein ACI89U_002721, partial [Gammaproteobacteria bacterium]
GSAIANPDAADKDEHSLYWQLSTLFFAVAWIITLLIWRTRAPSKVKKEVPRNDVVPLNTTEKNAFKTLEKACHNNDIADIRVGIISWAKCYWPDKNIKTLQDIDRLCGLMQLKEGLRELDKLLYGNASDSPWNSENLLRSLKQLRDNDKQTHAKKEKNLKPLYQS